DCAVPFLVIKDLVECNRQKRPGPVCRKAGIRYGQRSVFPSATGGERMHAFRARSIEYHLVSRVFLTALNSYS
ncbi:MAG: hypothetical protein ABIN58_10640, partial [candidate division WOR-3 bacterium]